MFAEPYKPAAETAFIRCFPLCSKMWSTVAKKKAPSVKKRPKKLFTGYNFSEGIPSLLIGCSTSHRSFPKTSLCEMALRSCFKNFFPYLCVKYPLMAVIMAL